MDHSKILAALYTVVLVFAVTFATQMLAVGFNIFELDLNAVEAAANSGVAAVLALFVNYFNPKVTRYGLGSTPAEPEE